MTFKDNVRGMGLSLGALALVMAMSGCSHPENDPNHQYTQFCVNEKTKERVDDKECEKVDDDNHAVHSGGSSFLWGYMAANMLNNNNNVSTSYPAVGQRVDSRYNSAFTTSKPDSGFVTKTTGKTGGETSKTVSSARSAGKGSVVKSGGSGKGGFGGGSKSGGGSKGG